jgi:hypothetical protein
MISCGNQLTFLDISQNIQLKTVGIDNMPMLQKVFVWELPFPPEGVTVLMDYSPRVVFVEGNHPNLTLPAIASVRPSCLSHQLQVPIYKNNLP